MASIRKALLCCIEGKNWDMASKVEVKLKENREACSYFLKFFCALYEGDESRASLMIEELLLCNDFEINYLYWAAKLANEQDSKTILTSVLEHLIHFAKTANMLPSGLHAVVAIRCSLNLLIGSLRDSETFEAAALLDICQHFEISKSLLSYYFLDTDHAKALQNLQDLNSSASSQESAHWFFAEAYNLCCESVESIPSVILDRLADVSIALGQLLPSDDRTSAALAWLLFFSTIIKLHLARDKEDADWNGVKQRAQEAIYHQSDPIMKQSLFCAAWEATARLGEWDECFAALEVLLSAYSRTVTSIAPPPPL
ncbi:hypothetical protein BT69DRAFT_1359190 [Atractiella rhizophila]|nr:hypothetical protein BT69DRAFT_1359190 [Atractiella rhizophila]